MSQVRVRKMQEFIKQEVSRMLVKDIKDSRLGFVTVTDVTVTGDLREATVYVSLFGTLEENERSLAALRHAKGFIRTQLGRHLTVRHTPDIDFAEDTSIAYGSRIDKMLAALHKEQAEENDSEKMESMDHEDR